MNVEATAMAHDQCDLTIAAPAAAVYAALTTPEALRKWWTMTCEASGAVGGRATFRFDQTYQVMQIESLQPDKEVRWKCVDAHIDASDGKAMWGMFVYHETAVPGRIVLVNSFSDEEGGFTRHPIAPTWPLELLSTTTLAAEGDGTRLTIEWSPRNPTDEERKMLDSSHDGMKQGWSGTFDQPDGYLAEA